MGRASIRAETAADSHAIRAVTQAAFAGAPHSSGTEAAIVEALRAAGVLTISLVAIANHEVVGHAAFSPVAIDGGPDGWFGLGPVSVKPERQGEGIGHMLIAEGLQRLREAGATGCVVLGDPAFYGRFGFVSDPALFYPDVPAEYFQRLAFDGSAPAGRVDYPMAFGAS